MGAFYVKKKRIKQLGIIAIILVISLSAVISIFNQKETVEKVNAVTLPTTGSITLDAGDASNKYVVPADATGLDGLDLPTGQGWFQNDGVIPSLSKGIINTYTSNVNDTAHYVGTLNDGSLIFQTETRSEGVVDHGTGTLIYRKSIVKTEEDGEKNSQVYLATGTPNYDHNANRSPDVKESSRDSGLPTILNNNHIQGVYLGNSPIGTQREIKYSFNFDGNTMSNFTWRVLTGTPSELVNPYVFHHFGSIPNQNDGKIYVNSGGYVLRSATEIANFDRFEMLEYDPSESNVKRANKTLVFNTYQEATGQTSNMRGTIEFFNMYRYGNSYIVLVRFGTYIDSGPSVSRIYKLDASTGNQIDYIQVSDRGVNIQQANAITGLNDTDSSHYYYMDYSNQKARLMKLEPNSFTTEVLKEFPIGTTVQNISKYINNNGEDEYNIYMTLTSNAITDPMFNSYLSSPGIVLGTLDKDFEIKNLRGISATGTLSLNSFTPVPNTNRYAIAGTASIDSNFIQGPFNKKPGANRSAFYGTLTQDDDYSPGIKFTRNNITVDTTLSDTQIEAALLDGIEVTDTYDFSDENISGKKDVAWLRARINRNPKRINYAAPVGQQLPPIDWKTLGFDKTKTGPQKVKYFVTDGSLQASTISRWINKLGEETITDDENKFALDAQNFHIPLDDVTKPAFDEKALKKMAKTIAWNLSDNEPTTGDHGNGLDEDGAAEKFSDAKVEVDPDQLAALQNAKVAKPYPVDITYTPDDNSVEPITSRVWVFVTTDNTVANPVIDDQVTPAKTSGVVIYADDYTIPYRSRLDQDLDSVLADGKVKAYNYYAKDRTAELAPLPDSSSGQSNWNITDLNVIHDPFSGGAVTLPTTVTPELNYKWSGASDFYHTQDDVTKATLDVTLTGDVLLNVRQVIQGTNDQLKEFVVPTEGYLTIQNTLNNSGTPAVDSTYQSQVTVSSGKKGDDPDFTTFGVDIEHLAADADQVDLSAILPSFYKNVGYSISNDKASHASAPVLPDTKISLSRGDIHDQGEYWITIYLEPNGTNGGNPQPYSWDYKHNDLGKIVNP